MIHLTNFLKFKEAVRFLEISAIQRCLFDREGLAGGKGTIS